MTMLFVALGIILLCFISVVLGRLVHKSASAKEQEDLEQMEFLKYWCEGYTQ